MIHRAEESKAVTPQKQGREKCPRGVCGTAENLSQNNLIRTLAMVPSLGEKLNRGNSPEPLMPQIPRTCNMPGDWKFQRMSQV